MKSLLSSEKFKGKISPPVTSWITEYVHVQSCQFFTHVGVNNKSNHLLGVIFRAGSFYMREKFIQEVETDHWIPTISLILGIILFQLFKNQRTVNV